MLYLDSAERELVAVPAQERAARLNAVARLEALGPHLPFPHQSAVKGVSNLRELRPRSGRSPWRAFYRQQGEVFVIAAIGPEAGVHHREFDRMVAMAIARLEDIEK